MTEKINEILKKLKSDEAVYNRIAKEQHHNRKNAREVLARIRGYKAQLAALQR